MEGWLEASSISDLPSCPGPPSEVIASSCQAREDGDVFGTTWVVISSVKLDMHSVYKKHIEALNHERKSG